MGVLVNGVNYSWGNIKLVLFGVPVIGVTKINYKEKQIKENNYGIGNEPISRGHGKKNTKAALNYIPMNGSASSMLLPTESQPTFHLSMCK